MSVPTPALIKKQLDEKRASENTPPVETSTKKIVPSRGSSTSRRKSRSVPKKSEEISETTVSTPQSSNDSKTEPATTPKKPFVRKPHLTDRPLRGNEALQNLKEQLEKPARKPRRRTNPSSSSSGTSKTSSAKRIVKTDNKENN